ncbi:MAG TPA: ABC transporter substrate-binding protein [Streptosporangiales bacterium]
MRRNRLLGALVVGVFALAACNANPSTPSSTKGTLGAISKGGTLTILNDAPTIDLDPAKSQGLAITSLGLILRRLTTWQIKPGQEAKVVPDLATNTGTPSDGGKTWTYTLKDGLTYADGSKVTSQDIKYGVERSFAPELSGGLGYHKTLLVGGASYRGPYSGKQLASIETPDAKTIVFHLKSPYGDWPWIVSMPAFAPVPKAKDDPKTYGRGPVATGPYMVQSYKQGSSITLTRNPHWSSKTDSVRGGGPDKVVFTMGDDASVTARRLIADSGDDRNAFSASFVPPAQLNQIEHNATAKPRLAISGPGPLAYLALNVKHKPLDNLDVRKAFEYAVDKRAFQVASGGSLGGSLASTLITPGIPGRQQYDLYPTAPDGDVAKAKQLLAKGGYPKGKKLTFLVQNDPQSLSKAQAIQEGLKRVGIATTLRSLDQNTFYTEVTNNKGDYDITLGSWQPDFPSANGNIQPLFASSEIGNGGFNLSRYSNPQVDSIIQQATAETNPQKAQQLWAQADKRIMQDAPIVPLLYTRNAFLHGSNVQNFFVPSFPAYPDYLTVSLKQ